MKEETKKQASKRASYWRYRLYKFQELHPVLSKREDSKMEFTDVTKMLALGVSIEIGTYDAIYSWSSVKSNEMYNKVTVKQEGVSNPYILIFIGEPYEDQSKSFLFDNKDEATQWLLKRMHSWCKRKPTFTDPFTDAMKMCLAMVQNLA